MYVVIAEDILDPETTSRTGNIQIILRQPWEIPQFRRVG
jgi:hypothetical protein